MDPGAYCRAEHFDCPWRDGHLVLPHFPVRRGGCWATFIESLRDDFCASASAGADNADDE
jgi:hypothetical protein